jgi:acyl-CoA oxidase
VVYARVTVDGTDHGVFPFSVALTDGTDALPGVMITPVPGTPLLALDAATVTFDHACVPHSSWLRGDANIDADGRLPRPIARPGRAAYAAAGPGQEYVDGHRGLATTIRHPHRRTSQGRLATDAPLIRLLKGLCERILPAAEELVDAFGIPTGLVAAEIG